MPKQNTKKTKKISVEKNPCVVIYLTCHGSIQVNDDLTIETVPHPKGRNITYLKGAQFGKSFLVDYHLSSRYPGSKKPRRYELQKVKEMLREVYDEICIHPTKYLNQLKIENRKYFKDLQGSPLYGPEFCKRTYGTKKAICVNDQFSHVPFVVKDYGFDDQLPWEKEEYAHGFIVMFEYEDKVQIFNLTYVKEFSKFCDFFLKKFNVTIPEIFESSDDPKRYEYFSTNTVIELIKHFPAAFTNFKFVDETCSNLTKETSESFTASEKDALKKLYEDEMTSHAPTKWKGGRRKGWRQKTAVGETRKNKRT
jgi:hypothetical protein